MRDGYATARFDAEGSENRTAERNTYGRPRRRPGRGPAVRTPLAGRVGVVPVDDGRAGREGVGGRYNRARARQWAGPPDSPAVHTMIKTGFIEALEFLALPPERMLGWLPAQRDDVRYVIGDDGYETESPARAALHAASTVVSWVLPSSVSGGAAERLGELRTLLYVAREAGFDASYFFVLGDDRAVTGPYDGLWALLRRAARSVSDALGRTADAAATPAGGRAFAELLRAGRVGRVAVVEQVDDVPAVDLAPEAVLVDTLRLLSLSPLAYKGFLPLPDSGVIYRSADEGVETHFAEEVALRTSHAAIDRVLVDGEAAPAPFGAGTVLAELHAALDLILASARRGWSEIAFANPGGSHPPRMLLRRLSAAALVEAGIGPAAPILGFRELIATAGYSRVTVTRRFGDGGLSE